MFPVSLKCCRTDSGRKWIYRKKPPWQPIRTACLWYYAEMIDAGKNMGETGSYTLSKFWLKTAAKAKHTILLDGYTILTANHFRIRHY